jgi:hypothetical protein
MLTSPSLTTHLMLINPSLTAQVERIADKPIFTTTNQTTTYNFALIQQFSKMST